MGWIWRDGELVKTKTTAKIKTKYPKYCKNGVRVCNPQATSFGDACGNSGCNKVSY